MAACFALLFACLAPGTGGAQTSKGIAGIEVVPGTGHTGPINAVAFSPDNQMALTGGEDKTARLWDTKRRELRAFKGHTGRVTSVAFSPDGNMVLTAGDDKTARLWSTSTGRELRVLKGHADTVRSAAFSPDGRTVVTASADKTARLWEAESGRELRRFGHNSEVRAASFSPDGKTIVTGGRDNIARLWDVASGRELRQLTGHRDLLNAAVFSPDGKTILTGSVDKTVRLWNAGNGVLLREIPDLVPVITAVFSPDGKKILVTTEGPTFLLDSETGGLLHELSGHTTFAVSGVFSPDGLTMLTGGQEGNARLWSAKTGEQLTQLTGDAGVVTSLAFSPDGRKLLAGTRDGNAHVWETASGSKQAVLLAHTQYVTSVAFSPDGKLLMSGGFDGVARLWDAASARELRELKTGAIIVHSVAFSPDSQTALTGNYDGIAQLWDVASGKEIRRFKAPSGRNLNSVAFSRDGRTILTAGDDKSAGLWDTATGRELRQFTGHAEMIWAVTFSPDGRTIATASRDRTVRMWDAASGREVRQLAGHTDDILSVAFSPDGRTLLTGGMDGTARLWDAASGRERLQLRGHKDVVTSAAFSLDGRTIFTGSHDRTLRVWDAASGEERARMIVFADGEWVTLTAEGFFNASDKGADLLNVISGSETYSIDQFRNILFRPDLVKEKLAGDPNGTVKAAAAKIDLGKVIASGNAPKVAITSPADESAAPIGEVRIDGTVTEQGGGVGRIEWRLNGQTLGVDTRGIQRVESSSVTASAGASIKVSQKMVLDRGDNLIELVAYNARGLVASQPARIMIKATGTAAATKPRLFVLAVGVNDYFDSRLKLNFAVPDARAVAASFEKAGKDLYESVRVVTVLDSAVTRADLEKTFTQLASEVKASDVFVFFVAGHGRTLDGHYYFLPQDFRYRDQNSYPESGISQEQWQKWIALIQARKSVLIYDTCESGSVTADPTVPAANTRGVQRVEEQAVAYDKLRNATGKTILAASTDTQPALEGYQGHGVFSYVVIEALEKAQTNANGLIEVTGLISYIDDKVPDVSFKAFKQRQIPQNKLTGSNFAVARPTAMSLPAGVVAAAAPVNLSRPTHVVIAPADVLAAASSGAVVAKLAAGTQVTLIETSNGWTAVARDGKKIGYVKEQTLLRLQ